MAIDPIERILLVYTQFGPGCPTATGPSIIPPLSHYEDFDNFGIRLQRDVGLPIAMLPPLENPADRNEFLTKMAVYFRPGTLVISNEDSTSYGILHALLRQGVSIQGVVAGDQHVDGYNYNTHGSLLSKANWGRRALDDGLVRHIVFFGARLMELAFFSPAILLQRGYFSSLPYALLRFLQGQHAGLRKRTTVLSDDRERCFPLLLMQAHQVLEHMDGVKNFGLNFDIDMFNSELIRGVDYGPHLPWRLREDAVKKYQKVRWRHPYQKMRARLRLWYNYWVATYVEKKIWCPGLVIPTQEEIETTLQYIHYQSRLNCRYVHLTEFEPRADDARETTANLLVQLVRTLNSVSHGKVSRPPYQK